MALPKELGGGVGALVGEAALDANEYDVFAVCDQELGDAASGADRRAVVFIRCAHGCARRSTRVSPIRRVIPSES